VSDTTRLETERLCLRPWRDDDAPALAAINAHPEVARYLNNPLDDGSGTTFLARLREHWTRHGWGHFAVQERAPADGTARLLGFVGVGYPTFMVELAHRPEIGWRLDPAVWGRGYASEAARAAREDAFGRLGLDELISIIHPGNARSRRVAERLGMAIEGQAAHPALGIDVDVWSARRPAL
jgi:RimJ/RimL family protein N-acetyltransferase